MASLHVAFFTNHSKGHVFPTLAIASTLLQRGHRVTYSAPESLGPAITGLGAEAITYEPLDGAEAIDKDSILAKMEDPQNPNDPSNLDYLLSFMAPRSMNVAVNKLSQTSSFYEHNKPDVILYDMGEWAGRIIASMWNIPAIQIFPYFALYNDFYTRESCAWCDPLPSDELRERLNVFLPLTYPIAELNIFLIPRAFQPNEHLFDERFFFSGPCILKKSIIDKQREKNIDDKPVIIVSLSASQLELTSDIDYFKLFINALSESQWKVILSIGDKIDPISLGQIPSNFEINQHTPQSEILPYASLFVGSGGAVSTLEALYYGLPSILIPQDSLHAEFAHRVEQLGLGVVLKRIDLAEELIRGAVAKVSADSAMLDKVREMQKDIIDSNAAERISDKIEEHLERAHQLNRPLKKASVQRLSS